jgi:SRSO17 transposase
VQADGAYGDITAFRLGLEQRDLEYMVQVKATTSAQPSEAVPVVPIYPGMGRPPRPRYADKPQSLRDLALTAGQHSARVGWREGDRGPLSSSFIALRVRPANEAQRQHDGVLPHCWLLGRMARRQGRAGQVLALKPARRLPANEGRTYRGLQHHLTCVTVAHAFLTTCRLQGAAPTPPSLRRRQP